MRTIEQIKSDVLEREQKIESLERELVRRRETKIKDIEKEISQLRAQVKNLKSLAVTQMFDGAAVAAGEN